MVKKLKCESCGESGEKMICPYQQDVNNTEVEVILCKGCKYERIQDI